MNERYISACSVLFVCLFVCLFVRLIDCFHVSSNTVEEKIDFYKLEIWYHYEPPSTRSGIRMKTLLCYTHIDVIYMHGNATMFSCATRSSKPNWLQCYANCMHTFRKALVPRVGTLSRWPSFQNSTHSTWNAKRHQKRVGESRRCWRPVLY